MFNFVSLKTVNRDNGHQRGIFCKTRSIIVQQKLLCMVTSSNGNLFRATGHSCGEFTGHRWIPRTKASDAELWCFLFICAWINGWVNNHKAGDLGRHRAHYDVTVMERENRNVEKLRDSYTWSFITDASFIHLYVHTRTLHVPSPAIITHIFPWLDQCQIPRFISSI